MVEQSIFRGAIESLNKLGLYDVILPFLLIFTLVFAILEKTKILGTENINGSEVPRKNLNSMVAFSVALFVIASSKAVALISEIIANVVVFVVITFLYILMIATVFHPSAEGKEFSIPKGVKYTTMIVGAIVLVIFFFRAIGVGDVGPHVGNFFKEYIFTPTVLSSIILLAVLIISLVFIVKEPKSKGGG